MGFFYYDYTYIIFVVPALLISIYAQFCVSTAFNKYSHIRNRAAISGRNAAEMVLRMNNVPVIPVNHIRGNMNDNFDPRSNTISLSDPVCDQTTVTAMCVAAHEAGHAVQYATKYRPMFIRSALVPITQISSMLAWPLVIIGLILPVQYDFVVNLGIILYGVALLFSIVTLPVEFNASRRAMTALTDSGLCTKEELAGAKKVLRAAAMTYVAATLSALLNLLRIIFIANRRR